MTDNKTDNRIILGCVADDFTGASDAASFLVKGGMETALFNGIPMGEPELSKISAVVIALKTRSCDPALAAEESLKAFEWLKAQGASLLYFKYCSTFDSSDSGNIGPVIDAVLEKYSIPYTILCPALPVNGRTVSGGRIYVNGSLLEDSPMRYHPVTPMLRSSVADLMSVQGKYPCIDLGRVREAADEGEGTVTETGRPSRCLSEQQQKTIENICGCHEHFYIVPDYETDEDGRRIAECFGSLKFITGGSGLLEHLGRLLAFKQGDPETSSSSEAKAHSTKDASEAKAPKSKKSSEETAQRTKENTDARRNDSFTLILAGSCSKATLGQIECFESEGNTSFRISPEAVLEGEISASTLWEQINDTACSRKLSCLLVYSSAPENETARVKEKYGSRAAKEIEGFMAEIGCFAYKNGIRNIIVAGGETSGAVAGRLGFEGFRIGESAAPGVPVMIPLGAEAVRLVLKSGNFGQRSFFSDTVRLLRGCVKADQKPEKAC
ncbi:MAG: four-carbon acid sugar kinase family protein [Clostridiales bacterium]|nr:four-carbon acid sugar kinase family protein [Clostridiales bacterium]